MVVVDLVFVECNLDVLICLKKSYGEKVDDVLYGVKFG